MKILELRANLFPDAESVVAALRRLEGRHGIARMDISQPDLGDEDWDRALAAVLDSDLVVVT